MQRLTVRLALLMVILILSGAFTKTSRAMLTTPSPVSRQENYYWYAEPEDSYNDYNSVADESWEWYIYYDEPVNTNPAGGTLVAEGYINNTYPHEFPPSVFLYVHPI